MPDAYNIYHFFEYAKGKTGRCARCHNIARLHWQEVRRSVESCLGLSKRLFPQTPHLEG
jgi:hypothetical protein